MKKTLTLLTSCLIFVAFAAAAQASSINWGSGQQHISSPNDLYHVEFSIATARTVVIYTNAGSHFDAGVYLWDSNKNFIDANEDGYKYSVDFNGHSDSISDRDAYIEIALQPGTYYMTLAPLVDGEYADSTYFSTMDDLIAYREGKAPAGLPGYYDGTGEFRFYVLNINSASPYIPAVPLPASALLLAPSLAAIGILRRKFS